ncbi:hypothetical protein BDN72DRAFT_959009 [Pluteus cervinus]|uniref:Uncharacterized protein n=1 Tax=Pluteus cervinus TaxID=181527 RepID=A0ACD3AXC7_9AGAR|nr:hypothetical protein BDN72DRAFT_959009 [Pluteus cervinus]
MPLPIFKKFRKVSFPFHGSFFLFSIDPVESVRHLNDPELDKIAHEMKPKRYLGFVESIASWDRSQPYIVYNLILVSHGLPLPNETEGIEPDMCLPILPTTYHPTNRQPLQPSSPLPLNNCYFHTLTSLARVRAKTTWRRRNDATILEPPEKAREFATSGQDMCRRDDAKMKYETREASNPTGIPQADLIEGEDGEGKPEEVEVSENDIQLERRRESPKPIGSVTNQEQDDDDDDDASFEDCASTQDGERGELEELLNSEGIFQAIFSQGFADNSIIAITDITYNISLARAGGFSEPEEFFEEEARLKQLMLQSKSRAIERARELDEATYGAGSAKDLVQQTTLLPQFIESTSTSDKGK